MNQLKIELELQKLDDDIEKLSSKIKSTKDEAKTKEECFIILNKRLKMLSNEEKKACKTIEILRNKTNERKKIINERQEREEEIKNKKEKNNQDEVRKYIKVRKIKESRNESLSKINENRNIINKERERKHKEEKDLRKEVIRSKSQEEIKVKKEYFKFRKKQVENLLFAERKVKKFERFDKIEKKEEKIGVFIRKIDDLNEKIEVMENEEIEIVKRMQKTTSVLNSSKFK